MHPNAAEGAAATPDRPLPTRIADRYRVLERLTHGGMGEILVATDETTGQRVALKRLFEHRGRTATLLFEREYHTLASLQHPCIVRVFDYGIDGTPFYTMELLDGQDLTRVAPAPYRDACRYLRDVASSLALLHARHLLHRDVSPRNVRITTEGRCKLLDFGALTSFGLPDEMIGTPPGMPPETVYGVPLDQRVDLYAVGALGYWLLTGRHAYPTRDPRELPELWGRPIAPPSAFAKDVPEALDQLILSLLSLDRVHRPSNAAEVMDQLSALSGLAPEDQADVAQSYLASPRLIGRQEELKLIKQHFAAAARSEGVSLVVEGTAGMGKTRLIDDVTLTGRVSGATVVRVDAELHTGPFGVALELARALVRTSPTAARRAAEKGLALLAHLVPELGDEGQPPADVAQYPGERRAQIQQALHRWVTTFSDERPLAILCDNVHAADQASIGFLLGLARQVYTTKLFLVSTFRTEETAANADALQKLRDSSQRMPLGPLDAEAMKALTVALFGDVPNVNRFAEWLDAGAAGNPFQALQLSRYAVAQHIVRYADGAWLLPLELPRDTQTLGSGLTAWALGRLSPAAREAAEALSVHDGALTFELCSALIQGSSSATPIFSRLDELVREGILVSHRNEVRFARASVRKGLFDSLDVERRRRLHRIIGDALLASGGEHGLVVSAGWHLIHAGDETRGADLLARTLASTNARMLLVENDLHAAVPGLEAAYAVYKRQNRAPYEMAPLFVGLIGAGYYVDWRLAAKYGDEAMAVFSDLLGLNLAARWKRFLGGKLSLVAGIIVARVRYSRAKRRDCTFRELFVSLISCVTYLVAISLIKLEASEARKYANVVAPFRALRAKLAPAGIAEYCDMLALFADNRLSEARKGFLKLLLRLKDERYYKTLGVEARKLFHGGALYALGVLETFRDTGEGLHYAAALEAQEFKFYDIVAGRLRIAHHAYRAEMDLIAPYRERLDLHVIQYGSAWQVEMWSPASLVTACRHMGDASGLKMVTDNLWALAKDHPRLKTHARLAEGTHALLRGDAPLCIEVLEELKDSGQLAGYPGCISSFATLANAYNTVGEHAKAKALCEDQLERLSEDDKDFVTFTVDLRIQHALADAALGDPTGAASRVDQLLEAYGSNRGPMTLFMLHQARARIALLTGNLAVCRRHTELAGEFARATNNPSLIAQWKRLDRKSQKADVPTDAASIVGHTVGTLTTSPTTLDDELATDLFEDDGANGIRPMLTSSEPPVSGSSVRPPASSGSVRPPPESVN